MCGLGLPPAVLAGAAARPARLPRRRSVFALVVTPAERPVGASELPPVPARTTIARCARCPGPRRARIALLRHRPVHRHKPPCRDLGRSRTSRAMPAGLFQCNGRKAVSIKIVGTLFEGESIAESGIRKAERKRCPCDRWPCPVRRATAACPAPPWRVVALGEIPSSS